MLFVIGLLKFIKQVLSQMSQSVNRSNCELVFVPSNGDPVVLFSTVWLEGMTVAALVKASDLLSKYPELTHLAVGIFSQCVAWDTLVKPGDRVEFYRPLLVDPKEKRRNRAKPKAKSA